jgi:hypothetical protein
MQVATLLIAVLGVVMSALSLGWQAATFVLTGGRVKAELRVGAMNAAGLVTMPASSLTSDSMKEALQAQGGGQPVVAVRVRNVGRLPVTITDWSLATTTKGGIAMTPVGTSIGPPLPHRMEAGDTAMWAVDIRNVIALVETTAEVLKLRPADIGIRAKVSLGTGRTVTARGTLNK